MPKIMKRKFVFYFVFDQASYAISVRVSSSFRADLSTKKFTFKIQCNMYFVVTLEGTQALFHVTKTGFVQLGWGEGSRALVPVRVRGS